MRGMGNVWQSPSGRGLGRVRHIWRSCRGTACSGSRWAGAVAMACGRCHKLVVARAGAMARARRRRAMVTRSGARRRGGGGSGRRGRLRRWRASRGAPP